MSAPPAYAIGQFRDADAEVARLRQQARAIAEVEDAAFRALGFPEVGVGLDVGCGPGFVAQRLRQARTGLRIIGLDLDRSALRLAREGGAALQASATALAIDQAKVIDIVGTVAGDDTLFVAVKNIDAGLFPSCQEASESDIRIISGRAPSHP